MKKILFVLLPILLLGAGCRSISPTNLPGAKASADLSYKNLNKIQPEFFNDSSIKELNLSHNNLTGALPAEIRKLTELKKLDISYNKMTGLPAELGQLSNLESLDVSYNQLTGLPYEIGNLKKLKIMNLTGNKYSVQDLEHIKKDLPETTFITGN